MNCKKIFTTLVLFFVFVIVWNKNMQANSFGILGNVDKYNIFVNTQKDGSINMYYDIELNVTAESVDNIKVKLPQGDVTLKTFDTSNISSVEFSYRKANITLNKTYTKYEKIHIKFSVNLANAYRYNEKKQIVIYRITIGDVKDFINNEIVVNWKKKGVYFQGRGFEESDSYVFKQNYSIFRNFDVMIQYKDYNFDMINSGKKFTFESYIYNYGLITIAIAVIILEIKNNIINRSAMRYQFRGKNVI